MSGSVTMGVDVDSVHPPRARALAARRQVGIWLLLCCLLVAGMVILGGVTRLTGSGLSMVTWKPVHGVIPPLDQVRWLEEFELYRASPEYRKVNHGMSLAEFKRIFWFEYAHRLLGRAIGLAFALPFLWFLLRRRIEARLVARLLLMFGLGGAQGLLGWWMVRSGLVDVPQVSVYRLTAHLGLAVGLFTWMLWTALELLRRPAPITDASLALASRGLLALALVTVLSGGFVAGLEAGLVYNTFPMMGAGLVPPEIGAMSPWWRNLFENVATVQFDHRLLATLTLVATLALWGACLSRKIQGSAMLWCHVAAALAAVQVALGIATLLLRVPVPLAAIHQANALLLVAALTGAAHGFPRRVRHERPRPGSFGQPALARREKDGVR